MTARVVVDEVAEVILVEPRDAFAHNVAALRATVDPRWSDRMFLPYDALLVRGRLVRDHAERVEPSAVVLRSGERLEADFLVLATGSTYPFPAKIGLTGTTDAKNHMRRTHEALAAAHSVLLLGAGPAGLEFAGEIKAAWPRKQVTLVDPRERILDDMPLMDGGAELATYQTGAPMLALSLGPASGASYTPATGLLGPKATARVKSADLRTAFYEQLFGLGRPNTLANR